MDDRSIFLSFRHRQGETLAYLVFNALRTQGYDVFMAVTEPETAEEKRVLLNQIAARAHFVLVLTQGALEKCADPQDWLRHEISTALKLNRNLVPVTDQAFTFSEEDHSVDSTVQNLIQYGGINVSHKSFESAMEQLMRRLLGETAFVPLTPTPDEDIPTVMVMMDQAVRKASIPTVKIPLTKPHSETLLGQVLMMVVPLNVALRRANQCFMVEDYVGAFAHYSEVLALRPTHALAQQRRAWIYYACFRDYRNAIAGYSEYLQLRPNDYDAYTVCSDAYLQLHDVKNAIATASSAIQLQSQRYDAYVSRADAYLANQQYEEAIADYNQAIDLQPHYSYLYYYRGCGYFAMGEYDAALGDFEHANNIEAVPYSHRLIVAGLAIAKHALGFVDEAKDLWQILVIQDRRYRNLAWVKQELAWSDVQLNEARHLVDD